MKSGLALGRLVKEDNGEFGLCYEYDKLQYYAGYRVGGYTNLVTVALSDRIFWFGLIICRSHYSMLGAKSAAPAMYW